jgi:DNA-binding response OmpR family regulator
MGRRILVVDDEPNIVTALEFLLGSSGYEVQVARTGQEALDALASLPPDLVLLDVMLPVVSGYDVCRRMRAAPAWRGVKIVLLTAKGREAEVRRGMENGADLYVVKPFSTQDLLRKIHGLLEAA